MTDGVKVHEPAKKFTLHPEVFKGIKQRAARRAAADAEARQLEAEIGLMVGVAFETAGIGTFDPDQWSDINDEGTLFRKQPTPVDDVEPPAVPAEPPAEPLESPADESAAAS